MDDALQDELQLSVARDLDVTAGQGGEGLLAQLGLQRIPGLGDRRGVLAAAEALQNLIELLQQGQQQLPAAIRVQTLNRQQTAGGIGQSSLNRCIDESDCAPGYRCAEVVDAGLLCRRCDEGECDVPLITFACYCLGEHSCKNTF